MVQVNDRRFIARFLIENSKGEELILALADAAV
jgi:hypothetical protein